MSTVLPGSSTLLLRALFKRPGKPGAALHSAFIAPALDLAHLARYNALFGFPADALPITYYYPLVQRAHLATMLAPAFPFRLLGMVHAENTLREERRPDIEAPLQIATHIDIEAPTERGMRYCTLHSRAEQDGAAVFHCTSRYLARRGNSAHDGKAGDTEKETMPVLAAWDLDHASGGRYAEVSGDWNPIHLWRWSARLFGLPSPIIHGMHTVGAACARLEHARERRLTEISARFKAPIVLGAHVELHADLQAAAYRVRCGAKPAVEGAFEFEAS
ncbi:MAG TPA: MaoC/PaaZ C-terminal domain-containing protein [Burkholderiaceae bacterium]